MEYAVGDWSVQWGVETPHCWYRPLGSFYGVYAGTISKCSRPPRSVPAHLGVFLQAEPHVMAVVRLCGRPREIQSAALRPGKVVYAPRDVVTYSCIPGYERESGHNKAVCSIFGNWEHSTLKCKLCGRPREIQSAALRPGKVVYAPRDVVTYSCIPGYERESGHNKAVCSIFGNWEHSTLKCKREYDRLQGGLCGRPREIQSAALRPGKVVYAPRDVVTYSCIPGYERESGHNKAVCSIFGNWEHSTLKCKPTQCPKPGPLDNGQIHYQELTYRSLISFSCHTGYRLRGANQSECLESGTWGRKLPVCEAVTCPHPPPPNSAQLEYQRAGGRNGSVYRDVVTARCLHNLAMIGGENITCTENGTWSPPPECRDVTCHRPAGIPNGYMSFALHRKYNYKEFVSYGCNPPYALDGNRISYCDKDGEWSQKPSCRAPCHVTTPKANVLHNGRRTRVDEIAGQQIQHGDTLTYFCKNKELKCAYTVPSQCRDGNFTVPACYKKPGALSLFSTDPSKMAACAQER
ncbi:PREDICTED: LOW QUALITY PROTEIN: beta-2-glycoprotein 1 [Nanorana parkeri]|uniref:LOW QUALITY PROTEIN: beta-2-glycoprotein 1 n=1 Tax=Nanorana parkeri TaxID=125878 RepID=UPI00085435FC|nr:PREDICTED: LOW QUALITY PROTEIN: beta-2-glycoprotein 1 [Nanorana parkeri]